MKKTFRPWLVDQPQLLPPSVDEFVPTGHVAHFIRDLVRDQLDLSAIVGTYTEVRGYPPYDPTMMTALLLYGYSRGVYSSRRLARACEERLDFLAVTAMNRPDFRTISDFRKRHLAALSGLFVQVLKLCQKSGLVELANTGKVPTQVSADSGYCSEANIQAMEDRKIEAFIATSRQKHGEAVPDGDEARRKGPKVEAMRQRLRDGGFDSPYRLRKQSRSSVRSSRPEGFANS